VRACSPWRSGLAQSTRGIGGYHPIPREHGKIIRRKNPNVDPDHPLLRETVPVPWEIHRGRGGLHPQGYNQFVLELFEQRGGREGITNEGLDEIGDLLRELGFR
jgi:hypothetical protein